MAIIDIFNLTNKGSPISALTGEYGLLTNPTGAWDKFKNGDTNEVNREIAEQNLAYQRESLDYNKALNERIFERADTSHQREVADLRAAGLNPLIATAGSETAGSATPVEALHNEYKHQDMGNLSAFQSIGDLLNTIQNYQIGFDYGREQKAKADTATAQATVEKQTAIDKIFNSRLDRATKEKLYEDLMRKSDYESYMGINSGMSEEERMARILSKQFEKDNAIPNEEYVTYGSKYDKDFVENRIGNRTQEYENLIKTIITKQAAKTLSEIIPF